MHRRLEFGKQSLLGTSNCGNSCKFHRQCSTWRGHGSCAGKGIGKNMLAGWEFIFCARMDSAWVAACLLGNISHGARENLILEGMKICFKGQRGFTPKPSNFHGACIWTCWLVWPQYPGLSFLFSWLSARDKRWACFSAFIMGIQIWESRMSTTGAFVIKGIFLTYVSPNYLFKCTVQCRL